MTIFPNDILAYFIVADAALLTALYSGSLICTDASVHIYSIHCPGDVLYVKTLMSKCKRVSLRRTKVLQFQA